MQRKTPCPRCKTSAFTLVELLVSSAIMSIVLAILLGTMSASLGLWRNTDSAISADREGRSANVLVHNDLRSAYVPAGKPKLWPSIRSNGTYLAFLTRKASDYQNTAAGDVGEVCFVEYIVEQNALKRRVVGSKDTYGGLVAGRFPTGMTNPFQVLATNIIPAEAAMRRTLVGQTAKDIAAITPTFVPVTRGWVVEDTNRVVFTNRPDLSTGQIFETNSRPYKVVEMSNNTNTDPVTLDAIAQLLVAEPIFTPTEPGDLPHAIEVNLPAADMGTLANRDLLANTNILVRNPGFFHFRVTLFPSP
jgi:prepilin-type N-terminal cleavage/methylation domain-containing protein